MLVGVDWGTSRLRASLIAADGSVVARTESDGGMMHARKAGFEPTLQAALASLGEAASGVPVLAGGMVGSRQGWVEAPYAPVPARLEDLSDACIKVPTGACEMWIAPGVAVGTDRPLHGDVMRGEEVEIFGALDLLDRGSAELLLPGTHSKWVRVEDGAIAAFRTVMTGDVFAALTASSVLSATTGVPNDDEAFQRGLAFADGLQTPADLLGELFKVRTENLFGRLGEDASASFLSGILIGCEVAGLAQAADPPVLIGAGPLVARYRAALERRGVAAEVAPDGAAVRGLTLIAGARGLL